MTQNMLLSSHQAVDLRKSQVEQVSAAAEVAMQQDS